MIYVNAWPDERFGYNDLPDAAERARVFDRALEAIERLRPDMILIACNTLSILYELTAFSRRAAVPIRGIIHAGTDLFSEALAADPGSSIVIFGTKTTIESDIHRRRLIERGVAPERVAAVACHGLAAAIDDDPGGEETRRRLAVCADEACRSTMKESPWRGNPLRLSPLQRSLRFLPPFLARCLNPVLRPRGHAPLESPTAGSPRHAAEHALRSSKSGQTLYAGLACTHYGWVADAFREELEKRIGRRVVTLDPNERLAAATAGELTVRIASRDGAPRSSSSSASGSVSGSGTGVPSGGGRGTGHEPRPATKGSYPLGAPDDRLPAPGRGACPPVVKMTETGTAETRSSITVEVVSKVALDERKRRAAAARLEPVSELTAGALLNYKHRPDLF